MCSFASCKQGMLYNVSCVMIHTKKNLARHDCVYNASVLRPLEVGAESLVEDSLHHSVGLSLIAFGKVDVVESDAPGAVVLLQAAGFGCQIGDKLVLGGYLLLEGCVSIALDSCSSFSNAATLAGRVSRAVSLEMMSSSCTLVSGISAMAAAVVVFLLLRPVGANGWVCV